MAWRAHRTGMSLVTPMYYGNMDSAPAFKARNQYFFGTELLAAPIITPTRPGNGLAEKRVWFPSGTWTHFFNGEQISGGGWHTIQAALEDIPVYAKAGAIVPLAPKVGWGGVDNPTELDLYVFPGADNTFDLYEDDGETTDYQGGKYAITRFSLSDGCFTIHAAEGDLSLVPATRTYRIHLRGLASVISASLPAQYDPATRTHSFEEVTLKPNESFTLTFTKE
jgi:alpha-glucosidase (family GH31 glycosyl hydrolase)